MMHFIKVALGGLSHLAHKASRSAALRRMLFNSIRLKRIETERFRKDEIWRLLAYTFLNRHRSRSQIMQDLWVSYQLRELRDGFFVEFGATDGVTNSNTWLFEKEYRWRGILAEPNPVWHAELQKNRSVAIDHRCVASSTGKVVTFLATNSSDPELSSIAEFSGGDHFAGIRADGNKINVETVSLNDLLLQHNAPFHIDYLSIDTEGNEFDILCHFDFSSRDISLLSIELNRTTEPRIEALLTENGYVRVFREFSQWDGWFVKSKHLREHVDCDDRTEDVKSDAPASACGMNSRNLKASEMISEMLKVAVQALVRGSLCRYYVRSGGRRTDRAAVITPSRTGL
jgi:FkbM family methyltransferase